MKWESLENKGRKSSVVICDIRNASAHYKAVFETYIVSYVSSPYP